MSMLLASRPSRSASALRNGGLSGAERSSGAIRSRTHEGSTSANTTAWQVKDATPASRGDGGGSTVTDPSAGGKLPRAAAVSSVLSGEVTPPSYLSPLTIDHT